MAETGGGLNPTLSVDAIGIATIVFDDPERPVNVLTEDVLRRLAGLIEGLRPHAASGEVRGVLFRSGKPTHFMAGADVAAIEAVEAPDVGEAASRFGQAVFLEVERLEVPTVAALDGLCLGGGLELALACRYRVASDDRATRLGLPEVQLGILPAWGGTSRLPRLIGLRAAFDLLLTGKQIDARKARKVGLVEAVLPHDLFLELSRDWLLDRIRSGPVASGASRGFGARLLEDTLPGSRIVISAARRRVMKQTGGHYPAPLRILEVVGDSLGRPLPRAIEIEARAAGELIASPISKHLLHVFRLREGAKREPTGMGEVSPQGIASVAVIGAGVMGGGIAQLAAAKEMRVRLKDIRHAAIATGLEHAREVFDGVVRRGRMTEAERDRAMDRISGTLDYSGFGTSDVVVEAVVERLDVKRTVLAEAERAVEPDCVLATNTSSLLVDEIAEGLSHPERFAGLHFFNPVDRMPLVEIVRGAATSETTIRTLRRFALALGKIPVTVNDGSGFVVNRILGPYLNEAGFLLADGVDGPRIDAVAERFGMPMGPLRLMDEIGLDIAGHAGDSLHRAFGDRMAPAPALAALREMGRLGRKGGVGFYRYQDGKPDGFDTALTSTPGSRTATGGAPLDGAAITRRLILPMMNEAARVLEDGVAESAADIDLAMIMGAGFPPFRGGLLRYADGLHLKSVERGLEELAAMHGVRFEPAGSVRAMAQANQRFYDRFPARPRT